MTIPGRSAYCADRRRFHQRIDDPRRAHQRFVNGAFAGDVEEAGALGTELPVTAQALECYDQAAKAGLGKGDITGIPVRWMKLRNS